MIKTKVIAIYDVGKTNKKLILFDEQYNVVYEESTKLPETKDEDGFSCEDVVALTAWIKNSFAQIQTDPRFEIKAVNFSGYGASFVYLGENKNVIPPLYNYLKPYSPALQKKFYQSYGGESQFSKVTASPVLGNLNSGMQLYRLKYEKPELFKQIKYALHLPQYLSFVLTSQLRSDITSIGCHTNLWNFQQNKYHDWVEKEGVVEKLAPVEKCNSIVGEANNNILAGVGLHDSSSALIPYFTSFNDPFILLSTGTWCISLNPFNHTMLSDYELHEDCLCYLSYEGQAVKASRIFAGYEHEQQVKRLAEHFKKSLAYYTTVEVDTELLKKQKLAIKNLQLMNEGSEPARSAFGKRKLEDYKNYEEAYHQFIVDIVAQQVRSTNLVLRGTGVKRIFVDGGFSRNPIYMYLMAESFPTIEVYAASVAQASALGAALVIHQHWNNKPLPSNIIDMKLYSVTHQTSI
ncbi:MAG TPA: FGGY family carbohydrate kinase [Chitinophagaceae bacterium]|nr:FGGY family carbohydrate kinase [Chitinophagaceae bacterium]